MTVQRMSGTFDLFPDNLIIITIIRIRPITTAKRHSARRLIIISWIIGIFQPFESKNFLLLISHVSVSP